MNHYTRAPLYFIIFVSVLFCSYKPSPFHEIKDELGVFSFEINGKPFLLDSITASCRKITGGEKQLSLNNERFVKFIFMNPTTKSITLEASTKREAFIRYEDPASNAIGIPVKGFVSLTMLDEENKVLSGEFEMEVQLTLGTTKKLLKITNGKFSNIPIVYK